MTQSLYQDHFGIRENPFSIIPDPHYLYMSQRHQEALAHLLYGISDSGGFVLLTGEVGTGKTTICRALIEQLPENVNLALILNPRLTEPELMAAICDEMRIPYPLGTKSLKDFFDFMNRYLLDAHARGRNPVLMIDEAQNLSPEVLELIRLLTNLETAQKKLLQIILVGQPELNHILAQENQRQTSQRITARYHLMPLGLVETRNYINHRLRVAGLDAHVFSNGSIKAVHKAARGIPRLINSICDRALLAAYAEGKKQISPKMARSAAAEVLGTQAMTPGTSVWRTLALALAITGLIFWIGFDPYRTGIKETLLTLAEPLLPPPAQTQSKPVIVTPQLETQPEPIPETPSVAPPQPAPSTDTSRVTGADTEVLSSDIPPEDRPAEDRPAEDKPTEDRPAEMAPDDIPGDIPGDAQDVSQSEGTLLGDMINGGTPDHAFIHLFSLWGKSYTEIKGMTPCDKAKTAGLSCVQGATDLIGLKAMNRPVSVSIVLPDGEHMFGVVTKIMSGAGSETITLQVQDRTLTMATKAFSIRWPGDYLAVWQPTKAIERPLVFGQQGPDVRELRRLLAKAGFADSANDLKGEGSVFFGPSLREKIRTFQETYGLRVDGIAGPDTVMRISGVAGETGLAPIFTPPQPAAQTPSGE